MPSRPLRTFTVLPHLPKRLQGLQKLAYNLWWCWNHDAIWLFRRIDDRGQIKADQAHYAQSHPQFVSGGGSIKVFSHSLCFSDKDTQNLR